MLPLSSSRGQFIPQPENSHLQPELRSAAMSSFPPSTVDFTPVPTAEHGQVQLLLAGASGCRPISKQSAALSYEVIVPVYTDGVTQK